MSRSKRTGTTWESAVVAYLQTVGVTHAERRAPCGTQDRGDIAGIPGVVIECKNERTITLAAYADETEQERRNDHADIGVAWIKRRGKASPADGYAVMTGAQLVQLLTAAGYLTPQRNPTAAHDNRAA